MLVAYYLSLFSLSNFQNLETKMKIKIKMCHVQNLLLMLNIHTFATLLVVLRHPI
jgi:hypothetical protein